jgi:hypothetical protein
MSQLSREQPNLAAVGHEAWDVLNKPSILRLQMLLWLRWFQHVFYVS